MVKLFVGNIPSDCARVDVVDLFEKYGKVKDCDIIRNFAFIHIDDEGEAKDAVDALHKSKFMGVEITVEESSSRPRNTHKIYVGNISSSASRRELQKLFEEHGEVSSCDIIKDFAFVHMSKEREAEKAIKDLDGMTFSGRTVKVEFARNNRQQNQFGPPGGGYRDYQQDRWHDNYSGRGMGGYRGGYGRYNSYNNYNNHRTNYGGYGGGRGGGGSYYRRRSPERRRRSRSRSRSDSRSRSRSRSPRNNRKSLSRSPRHNRKSSSRSPRNNRKSSSRSPRNNRKSSSRSPLNNRKSSSRSPRKNRKSSSPSPRNNRKSSSRSPRNNRKSSSRSRSKSHTPDRRSVSPDNK